MYVFTKCRRRKPHHEHAQGKASTGVFVLRGRVTHPKAQRNDAVTAITLWYEERVFPLAQRRHGGQTREVDAVDAA
jgi:hypothetical protein